MANGDSPATTPVNLGGWLQGAWDHFLEDAVPWLLIGFVYLAAVSILSQIPVVGWVALLVVNGPLVGGMFYAAFARMRGTPVTVGMLFAPFQSDFMPLALVGIVGGLLGLFFTVITCGLGVFLVFPLWMFAIPLVLEQNMPFWDALERSRKTVQAQLAQWILFGFVCLLIMHAGILALGIGVVATVPIGVLLIALAYRDVFGLQAAGAGPVSTYPPPPPPEDDPAAPPVAEP